MQGTWVGGRLQGLRGPGSTTGGARLTVGNVGCSKGSHVALLHPSGPVLVQNCSGLLKAQGLTPPPPPPPPPAPPAPPPAPPPRPNKHPTYLGRGLLLLPPTKILPRCPSDGAKVTHLPLANTRSDIVVCIL